MNEEIKINRNKTQEKPQKRIKSSKLSQNDPKLNEINLEWTQ